MIACLQRDGSAILILALIVLTGAAMTLSAHPLGGVLQKTVLSDLTITVLIKYNTHIGPQVLLT